ncbi:hypothetical protein V7S43_005641 [Phytophthora oleae]|uniref:Ankyrin repeat-containing domain n=1 Tax=Phytophthora oleae TaxID=2107226 RepID=A0ABD3FWB2_9STRA
MARYEASPAMQVLTSKALHQHIVSFMDGLPHVVFKFARTQRFKPRLEGRYPSSRGLLPQLAVICEEFDVLDALLKLVKSYSSSHHDRETEFHGVVRCAVRFDKLNMLQWLERKLMLRSYEFEADLMDIAVGHTKGVEVMNWLLANHVEMKKQVSSWALRLAAYNGELVKMKWLHTHGFRGFSCTTADDAACAGNTNVLRFLLEYRREGCSSRALDQAAMHGHIEVVSYLFSFIHGRNEAERHRVTARASFAMTKAAMCGHAEVVGFLGRRQVTPLSHTLLDVVATGELQVLKELCRYSNEGCLVEARRQAKSLGHADIAAFLRTQIVPTAWACRLHRHSRSGPRRCQRKTKGDVILSLSIDLSTC